MTFAGQPIGAFLDSVASGAVTPSGGAVAGVGGAMGAALCEMVCLHTTDADGTPTDLDALSDTLADRRHRLLELADEDAVAVDEVQAAFEADDPARIQAAQKQATEVPLATAETCLDVVEAAVTVTAEGTSVAVPDAAVGALLAHAALEGALSTVCANLGAIDDDEYVAETEQRATEVEQIAETAMSEIRTTLDARC